ncbi:MAG: nucleotidyltransferase domain-containing protein [Candidatus Nanohaloarchaea archaeon]|nr:nucleotidyltransferase domain-containing protein [Candidatus Nanohaloarchaea archaeon]
MSGERYADAVEDVLEQHEGILFAYLYGSRVKGVEREDSDLDIAVYTDNGLEPRELSRLIIALEDATGEEVDVAVLNDAGVIFQHQVVKYGEPVYVADEEVRIAFETRVYRRYDDYKPFFEEYNRVRRVTA